MNHPEYQRFYDEFYKRLSRVRDGAAFRKECERIQDELEEEQRQTEKAVEKLTGRSPQGVKTAYSAHEAARERLIAKQAAATAAMLDLQNSYEVRTFSSDVVRPKVVTKGMWHLVWRLPFAALMALMVGWIANMVTEALVSSFAFSPMMPVHLPEQFQHPSVRATVGNLVSLIVGTIYFIWQVRLTRRGQ